MENMINFAAEQTVVATTQLDFDVILVALGLAEQPVAQQPAAENSMTIEFDENECEGPTVVTRLGTFGARYVIACSARFSGRSHVQIESTYGWLFEEIGGSNRSDMLLDSKHADLKEACEWLRLNHSVSYAHTSTFVEITLK